MKHKVNPLRHKFEFKTDDDLYINIESERLNIRSIKAEDEKDCIKLMGDPIVMEKFGTGIPYDEKKVKDRLEVWKKRWIDHDPFGTYAVLEKNSKEFIGIIAMGHSKPGESEPSYIFHQKFWGKGYGSETVDAVIQSLIPRLMLRSYKLEHKSLNKLVATARLDNPASQKMLIGVGFKVEEKVHKYGAWRCSYALFAKSLRNEYQNFFTLRDLKMNQQRIFQSRNEDVDITVEEMANSSFGQQSYTARRQ